MIGIVDRRNRIRIVGVLIFIAMSSCGMPGSVVKTWELTGQPIRIQVLMMNEWLKPIMPGNYYLFRSKPPGSVSWQDVMCFRHDDPVDIPTEQVRVISPTVAYLFMGWQYAVTTDAGATWSVWNAEHDLTNWKCCNYQLIKSVTLSRSGSGTMVLNSHPYNPGEVPMLETHDFGRHWSIPKGA